MSQRDLSKKGWAISLGLFNNETIRMVWDRDKENYYLSVIDIVSILSESKDGKTYWRVLKHRLKN